MFLALELYYSKLFDVDPTKVTENKPNDEQAVEVENIEDEHAGHNHE